MINGDLWGGNDHLSFQSFAFSKPQVTEGVSPRPYLPKQKELSHWGDSGGIGSITPACPPLISLLNWLQTVR